MAQRLGTHGIAHEVRLWTTGIATGIAGHGAATTLLNWATGHSPMMDALPWLIVFVLLTLAFYWLFAKAPSRLPGGKRWTVFGKGFLPWLAGDAAVLSLYGTGSAIHAWFGRHDFPVLAAVVYALVLVLSTVFIARWPDNVLTFRPRYVGQVTHPNPRSHLILILSNVDDENRPATVAWSDPPDLAKDLDALVQAKKSERLFWKWEMPLRAIRTHEGVIRSLTLLCSPQSIRQAPRFAGLVRSYSPFTDLNVAVWVNRDGQLEMVAAEQSTLESCSAFDFSEDLDDLSAALTDLLNHLFVNHVRSSDIVIDFTGGQKPISFVAAAATLRGDVLAQYIDTNSLEPCFYNLVTNPEPRGAG
jgi:hypothetical protein